MNIHTILIASIPLILLIFMSLYVWSLMCPWIDQDYTAKITFLNRLLVPFIIAIPMIVFVLVVATAGSILEHKDQVNTIHSEYAAVVIDKHMETRNYKHMISTDETVLPTTPITATRHDYYITAVLTNGQEVRVVTNKKVYDRVAKGSAVIIDKVQTGDDIKYSARLDDTNVKHACN